MIDKCVSPNVKIIQYADDVAIYSSGTKPEIIQSNIQNSLNSLSNNYKDIGLSISIQKTEYVVFTRKYKIFPFHIFCNNVEIRRVFCFKYLGIMFDSKCTWKTHVNYIAQRCTKRLNFLKSISGASWGSDPHNMLIVYKSTIRAVLEYGAICFFTTAKSHKLKLERISVEIITHMPGTNDIYAHRFL